MLNYGETKIAAISAGNNLLGVRTLAAAIVFTLLFFAQTVYADSPPHAAIATAHPLATAAVMEVLNSKK